MLREFLERTGAYEGRICKSIGQRVIEQVFERSLTGQENPRPIGRATECWKIIQPVQPCSIEDQVELDPDQSDKS